MSIPADPSVSDIVTEGLKKGGRVNPSAGDITDATNIHFQEVKADLYLKAPHHYSLQAQECLGTTVGVNRYNWPIYAEELRSVQLIAAPADGYYQSTAQGGGSNYITLAAGFSETQSTNIVGRTVCLTNGTGEGQFAQITSYDDSTKQATIEATWASLTKSAANTWVPPDNTTEYLVENIRYKLWGIDKPVQWDTLSAPFQQGTPSRSCLVDRQIWLDKAPDRVYALMIDFWFALDQLDETDTLFTGHLRKFRSLWTVGVASKVAMRFDDKREPQITAMYNYMLDLYGTSSAAVGQVVFQDY